MSAQRVDALAHIDVLDIHPNNANPRSDIDPDELRELAASIREHGLIQPIVVERRAQGGYRIIAGHRRYAALLELGAERALCVIRTPKSEPETLLMMLVENGQRVRLDPLDEARTYRALMDEHGFTQAQLSRRVGKAQSHVSMRLNLLALTPAEQQAVRDKDLPLGQARQVARRNRGIADNSHTPGWHLSREHPLATDARTHCDSEGHPRGRRLAGVACGACWEHVIRLDERTRGEAAS